MTKRIPFLRPSLVGRNSYLKYLKEIDENNIYSNFGPLNTLFERRVISEQFDDVGAVATVANATLGLMLAIAGSRRPGGRYALMPSFTFAAAPLAALWCGLEPYFVDVRDDDWLMDEELLAEAVTELGEDVAVVIPYATFGTNMKLDAYRALHASGVPVVVDAAASFGATGSGGLFGAGFPGAIVFSFHATKTFGIGEGGMVYSGTPELVDHIRRASNFGFSSDRESTIQGLNAKLSEYAAAIALATLDVYGDSIARRHQIYDTYVDQLTDMRLLDRGWALQRIEGTIPFQFVTVLCPEGRSNTHVVERLATRKIDLRTYFAPSCHQQQQFGSAPRTAMTVTERLTRRVVSLPLWEAMTPDDIHRVVEGLVQA